MPSLDKCKKLEEVLARLVEIVAALTQQATVADEKSEAQSSKEWLAAEKAAVGLAQEIETGQETFDKLTSGSSAPEADTCEDLLVDCQARLIALTGVGFKLKLTFGGALQAAPLPLDRVASLVREYRDDTRKDKVWGGDLEAHLAATALGLRCRIFTYANVQNAERFRYVTTVGANGDPMAPWHLYHSGNHYQPLKENLDNNGGAYTPVRLVHVPYDGNCLYSSLQAVAIKLHGQMPRNQRQLRAEVADAMTDADARVALLAIGLSGDWSGVGPAVRRALAEITSQVSEEFEKSGKSKESPSPLMYGSSADGNAPARNSMAEILWALSVTILAFAKITSNKALEVQGMKIDRQLYIASNSREEIDPTIKELCGKKDNVLAENLVTLFQKATKSIASMDGGGFAVHVRRIGRVLRRLSVQQLPIHQEKNLDQAPNWHKAGDAAALHLVSIPSDPAADYALHAEQKLLVGLAKRLNAGLIPKEDIVCWGTKSPCSVCLGVFTEFLQKFKGKLGGRTIVFSHYPGWNPQKVQDVSLIGEKRVLALDVDALLQR